MVGRGVIVLGVGVGIAAAAGCYDPTFPLGLPCGDGCPEGLVCEANVCVLPGGAPDAARADARVDAPPDDDDDGDGIANGDDNCAGDANPDQHDEDGDAVGDVCDVCPHRADAGQADGDGDRVGDACDPGPEADTIVFFDPFTADLPAWTLSGPWVRANDKLSVGAGGYGADLDQAIGTSHLELGGRIVALGATLPHQMTLRVSRDATTSIYCEMFQDDTDSKLALTSQTGDVYTGLGQAALPNPLPTGELVLSGYASPAVGEGGCRAEVDGSTSVVHADAPVDGATQWHINVHDLAVELDYAIQIDAQ